MVAEAIKSPQVGADRKKFVLKLLLLIATTLVAFVLGLGVWLVR